MKKAGIILFIAVLFTACDEKDIRLYPSFEESTIVNVNSIGEFDESTIIYASQINDAVNDLDLEEDGEIERVAIEGVWVVVTPLDGNTAESVMLNVDIASGSSITKPLLKNYKIDVPSKETVYYLPDDLDSDGVVVLKSRLNSIVVDGELTNDVDLFLYGSPSPEYSTIKLQIEVFVKGCVVFVQTVDML